MRTYVELTSKISLLDTKREELLKEKEDIFTSIYNLIDSHKESLSYILPINISLATSNKLEDRLDILEEEIENLSVSPEEKEDMIKLVKKTRLKIPNNNEQIEDLNKEKAYLENEQAERKEYVKGKINEIIEIDSDIKRLRELIKKREEMLNVPNLESKIKDSVSHTIAGYNGRIKRLIEKKNRILEEEGLFEDIKLLAEEEQNNQTYDDDYTLDEEVDDYETTLEQSEDNKQETGLIKVNNEETGLIRVNDTNPEQEQSSESLDQTESLNPEKPKKVKKVEEANTKLKLNILKKAGGITLGVMALATTVALVVTNPLVLAIPAGGLIWEQFKEQVLKKK